MGEISDSVCVTCVCDVCECVCVMCGVCVVQAANAAHHCFSLSLTLLRHLPPSYDALLSIVDGSGLSCKVIICSFSKCVCTFVCMMLKYTNCILCK